MCSPSRRMIRSICLGLFYQKCCKPIPHIVRINIFKARMCECHVCFGERGRGWIPTILFVLCPTLPASLFIALLCSFHTELMRKAHTLNTLLLAGTVAHIHTVRHTLCSKTHCSDLSDADGTAASLLCQNVNIFCSCSASVRNQLGSRLAFVSLDMS